MTTDETRSVLQAYAHAWAAGDLAHVLDAYADDVVFHYSGETDLAGDHHGRDAAVEAMTAASARSGRQLLDVVDVLAGDALGAIVARERFTRGDQSDDVMRVFLYRVEAGKIAECWLLDPDQRLTDRYWAAD